MTNAELTTRFFLQLAFILVTCRVVSYLCQKIGQPPVVGEMIAGVVMGPSLFALFLPAQQAFIFPQQTSSILYAISHVGLVLYMFLVGAEFDGGLLRQRMRSVVSVSLAGMIAPLILGALLAYYLLTGTSFSLFGANVAPWQAMLFMGASICITAFPMLARIIYERGLAGTRLGTLALAAGSIDDASAWCILAVMLAGFKGNTSIAFSALLGGLVYVLGVVLILRRLLAPLGKQVEQQRRMSSPIFSLILIIVMLGAWFTDAIGIYSIFGAFILGTAMPRGKFVQELRSRLEPISTYFLLPLFFIYSGLHTRIGLINTLPLLGVTILILFCAILGKGVACWLAARLNGESNREALAIGSLMNARGLIELIILNVGREQGIIEPTLFSMMVIMAIVTTLMASPLFEWVYGRQWRKEEALKQAATDVQNVGEDEKPSASVAG